MLLCINQSQRPQCDIAPFFSDVTHGNNNPPMSEGIRRCSGGNHPSASFLLLYLGFSIKTVHSKASANPTSTPRNERPPIPGDHPLSCWKTIGKAPKSIYDGKRCGRAGQVMVIDIPPESTYIEGSVNDGKTDVAKDVNASPAEDMHRPALTRAKAKRRSAPEIIGPRVLTTRS